MGPCVVGPLRARGRGEGDARVGAGRAGILRGSAALTSARTPEGEVARLREAVAELERQLQDAHAVARIARLVNETLDLTTVGERIAESVLGLLGVHSSAIRLLRPDGTLGAIALGGRAKEYVGDPDVVPAGVGLVGRAAVEGGPMWTEDIRTDARFALNPEIRERNAAVGIIAGLAVPLRAAGKVIGVLSVGSPTPRAFTEAEVSLLQSFADQAAVAINNAQTQEALAKQAERLNILHEIDRGLIAEQAPDAIAAAALRPLRDLLGVPRAIVNLFDLEAGEVEWLAAAGRHRIRVGPGVRYSLQLMGDVEALKRGEMQVIDVDALPSSPEAEALLASGVHVYMVVPMIAGGELIGALSFGGAPGPFPADQVGIAQEAAAQQESVEQILRAGRHLLGLINEILDISRIEAGRLQLSLEPVPVQETVRQAIELVQPSAADAHVSVRAEAIGERLHVMADRQRLQQVLLNLLSNGVKYNRAGGT